MSLPLPQDTDDTAPQPSLGSARKAHPIRAFFAILRQGAILKVRRWFRIPFDDLRDHLLKHNSNTLFQNQRDMVEMLQASNNLILKLHTRLAFYETHIPRMRELSREFERAQGNPEEGKSKIIVATNGVSAELKERLDHGIIGAIRR